MKLPGCSNWHKTGEKASEHCASSAHHDSMSNIAYFKQRLQDPQTTLPYVLTKLEVLRWVIKVIILCGKQSLPLRGH